jgi:general secretion pathway protein L
MAQLVIGLDVGASSIKVVGLERAMRGFLPVFYAEEPVGLDVDAEGKLLPYPERARPVLASLRAQGKLKGDIVVTGLPGDMATSRLVALPFTDAKRIAATLPFELEAAVPFDLGEVVWDWAALKRLPAEETTDVIVGMARRQSVKDLLDLLKEAGAEPRYVELEVLSLENLRQQLEPEAEREEPAVTPGGTAIQQGPSALPPAVAVVDMGASRTTVGVSAEDEVVAARSILRGGNDLTRALAKEFGLGLAEAEKGKIRESYIETPEAPAVYTEQKRISACLKGALAPLVRELRQTFQGVTARRRVRITKLYLCGGGSRVPNLIPHLARELNIHVFPLAGVDRLLGPVLPPGEAGSGQPRVPQAAVALSFALSGWSGARVRRIDFRQGDLAYRGDFEFVAARAPQLAAGFLALALLGGFNAYARHFVISRHEAVVTARQRDLCKAILGQSVDSAERCLAIMREKIGGGVGTSVVPQRSAVDAYIQLALHMPKGVTVKVEQLDITAEKIRVKGKTDSFENVDKIVKAMESGECFKKVEKGPARQEGDKISWSATVDLECAPPVEVPG